MVGDTLCSGTQHLYDPVEVDEWTMEEMLRAIAERYLLPSLCPCFIGSDGRIDRLLQMIREFKVDGVIYHSLRLCQLYALESRRVREVLKVPLLELQTDYSPGDTGQLRTRIEAFLELVSSDMA